MGYNYKNRNEVPEEYRWDLTKWFKIVYNHLNSYKNLLNIY